MTTVKEKRPRKRPTRKSRASRSTGSTTYVAHPPETTSAREHYHREKARRADRARPVDHPLEQARRAYEELLAKEAERARGGRPKKMVGAKGKAAKP